MEMPVETMEPSHATRASNGADAGRPETAPGSVPEVSVDRAVDIAGLASVIESLLFAAGAPVPLARLVEALGGPSRSEVLDALEALAEGLEQQGRGVRLSRVAGGYQLRTAAEHGPWVRRLLGGRPPRLSRAMLETLAIIAYRQPCTRPEIEAIRGVDVDAVLATLIDRRLARVVGRKEAPGRPMLYGTTKEFLEVFSLPDLSALPPLADLVDDLALLAGADLTVGASGVVPTPGAGETGEALATDPAPPETGADEPAAAECATG